MRIDVNGLIIKALPRVDYGLSVDLICKDPPLVMT
jgi:hypothetical protein